jgi:hypothetical protein
MHRDCCQLRRLVKVCRTPFFTIFIKSISFGLILAVGMDTLGSTSTLADEEIRRIKDSARETVARETRNVSSISVLTQAKKQLELAQALQNNGDYPGSLRSFYISAELMSKSMDSPEFKSGVLKREVTDFVSVSTDPFRFHR